MTKWNWNGRVNTPLMDKSAEDAEATAGRPAAGADTVAGPDKPVDAPAAADGLPDDGNTDAFGHEEEAGIKDYRPEDVPGSMLLNWICEGLGGFWVSLKAGVSGMIESLRYAIWGRWRK